MGGPWPLLVKLVECVAQAAEKLESSDLEAGQMYHISLDFDKSVTAVGRVKISTSFKVLLCCINIPC